MATLNSHEDLDAWRLATELKEWVFKIIKRPEVARHFKFCDDIKRSARSGPANLSEGFWRYRPRDNAKFVRIALGSLGETQNHLRDAFAEKYIGQDEYTAINALNGRALKTTVGWHSYLMSCPERSGEPPAWRRAMKPDPCVARISAQEESDSAREAENVKGDNEEPERITENEKRNG